jgi:hypothetical protein
MTGERVSNLGGVFNRFGVVLVKGTGLEQLFLIVIHWWFLPLAALADNCTCQSS